MIDLSNTSAITFVIDLSNDYFTADPNFVGVILRVTQTQIKLSLTEFCTVIITLRRI